MLKTKVIITALLLLTLVSRLPYAAPYLDDWDSVQFALAVHHYSLPDHQPHPPGYPLYILSARLVNLVFHDDTKSLTFLSILLGSLSVIPLYLLAKDLFNEKVALVSSLLFISIPVVWTLSEQALTDIPGLFFLISWSYLVSKFHQNQKLFLVCSFLGGVILGFRFNELPVILGILGYFLFKQRRLSRLILALAAFGLGVLSWVVPLIIITGLTSFTNVWTNIIGYVIWHDGSLAQPTIGLKHLFLLKLGLIINLLKLSYSWWFLIPSLIAIILLIVNKDWKKGPYQFIIVWTLAYLSFVVSIYNLELPRHVLPLAPPLAIITAAVLVKIIAKTKIRLLGYSLIGGLIIGLMLTSWQEIKALNTTTPPTIAPILYLRDHFNSNNTVLISSLLYRQFQYYLPNFKNYDTGKNDVPSKLTSQVVIIDHLSSKDKFPALQNYSVQDIKEFSAPSTLYPKTPDTKLYILFRKTLF